MMRYSRIEKTTTKNIPPSSAYPAAQTPFRSSSRLTPSRSCVSFQIAIAQASVHQALTHSLSLIAYSPLRYMDNTDRATHRPAPMPSSLSPRGHHQHSNITAAEIISTRPTSQTRTAFHPRLPQRPRATRDTQKQGRTRHAPTRTA